MNITATEPLTPTDPFIDWTVDTDRISRAAAEAFRTGVPDPWTLIEAECVLDLINAELVALAARQERGEPAQTAQRRLKAMRTEVTLAIKTFRSIEKSVDETSRQTQDGQAERQADWSERADTDLRTSLVVASSPQPRI